MLKVTPTGNPLPTIPTTMEEAVDRVLEDARAILLERHRKYGPGNIGRGGLPGLYVRLNDKLERLWHGIGLDRLVAAGTVWQAAKSLEPTATDESIEDAHLDGLNYFAIAELVRRGWWGLPFREEAECE